MSRKAKDSAKAGDRPDGGRRDFFRKVGFGAGAAGAAAVGLGAGGSAAAEPETGGSAKAGYRETAHVKKYYELARF